MTVTDNTVQFHLDTGSFLFTQIITGSGMYRDNLSNNFLHDFSADANTWLPNLPCSR